MTRGSGRCLCGAVRYKFDVNAVLWRGHCHCDSCRRATSSPFTTFFGVRRSAWRWFGVPPAAHASSPGVERMFCARCGSQLAYLTDELPDEIHGYAASLDAPQDFAPQVHFHADERLDWVHLNDGLPERRGNG